MASRLEKAGSSQASFKVSLTQGARAWLTFVEFICSSIGFLAFPMSVLEAVSGGMETRSALCGTCSSLGQRLILLS